VKVEILLEAEDELNASVAYYEEIQAGLGIRLKEQARAAIRWKPKTRKCRAAGPKAIVA
jgi:hypothetical protein